MRRRNTLLKLREVKLREAASPKGRGRQAERASRRERALTRYRNQEMPAVEIAREAGCHRSTLYRWIANARLPAAAGRRRGPGRPSPLGGQLEWTLRDRLNQDPRSRGETEPGWTTEMAMRQLRSITRYQYTPGSTAKLLRRLGYCKVRIAHGSDGGHAAWYWDKKAPERNARARTSPR
jgi:transposase